MKRSLCCFTKSAIKFWSALMPQNGALMPNTITRSIAAVASSNCSGVESKAGEKDQALVRDFISAARLGQGAAAVSVSKEGATG